MIDWQPIETAPKDGTPIFAWARWRSVHAPPQYGEYGIEALFWSPPDVEAGWSGAWIEYPESNYETYEPTHWTAYEPPA